MRLNITPSRHTFKLENAIYERRVSESIIINYKPEGEFDLINKGLSDSYIERIDLNRLETIFSKSLFPNYKGHFDKIKNEWYFNHTTKAKSNDAYMTVNKYGFIMSSQRKLPKNLIDKFGFEKVNRKSLPSIVEGLGIKNAVNLTGSGVVKGGIFTKDVSTADNTPITPIKITNFLNSVEKYEIGDIILVDSSVDMTNTSFLKLDGSIKKTEEFEQLFKTLGTIYGLNLNRDNTYGVPWKNSTFGTKDVLKHEENFPYKIIEYPELYNLGGAAVFGTKNKIFICGGYKGDRRKPLKSVYMLDLNSNGDIIKLTRLQDLPEARVFSRAVCFCGFIALVGGSKDPSKSMGGTNILKAKVNNDGTLGNWIIGEKLPHEFSRAGVFTIGNRLYISGGVKHIKIENNKTVEENIEKCIWTFVNLKGDLQLPFKELDSKNYISNDCQLCHINNGLSFVRNSEGYERKIFTRAFYSNLNQRVILTVSGVSIWSFGNDVSLPMVEYGRGFGRTVLSLVGFKDNSITDFGGHKSNVAILQRTTNSGLIIQHKPRPIKENDVTRFYHDAVFTNRGVFFLSGIPNTDPLLNEESKTVSKPVLVYTSSGCQDFLNYITTEEKPKEFFLPLVDEAVFKGKTYSYYIKAK